MFGVDNMQGVTIAIGRQHYSKLATQRSRAWHQLQNACFVHSRRAVYAKLVFCNSQTAQLPALPLLLLLC